MTNSNRLHGEIPVVVLFSACLLCGMVWCVCVYYTEKQNRYWACKDRVDVYMATWGIWPWEAAITDKTGRPEQVLCLKISLFGYWFEVVQNWHFPANLSTSCDHANTLQTVWF